MFFFVWQKPADGFWYGRGGSEMYIGDSRKSARKAMTATICRVFALGWRGANPCLLHTSDAADDLLCVDLGGCPISK